MDSDTLRMLRDLPNDLRSRGWTLVPLESNSVTWGGRRRYRVVYMRHFEQGVDDAQSPAVFIQNGRRVVRVSTRDSAGWDVVLHDAIELMRGFDARRVDLK